MGVGQPVYLEVDVATNVAVPNVTNVTWTLTQKPAGSAVPNLQASPLGTNMPVYEPSDRLVYQVAGATWTSACARTLRVTPPTINTR